MLPGTFTIDSSELDSLTRYGFCSYRVPNVVSAFIVGETIRVSLRDHEQQSVHVVQIRSVQDVLDEPSFKDVVLSPALVPCILPSSSKVEVAGHVIKSPPKKGKKADSRKVDEREFDQRDWKLILPLPWTPWQRALMLKWQEVGNKPLAAKDIESIAKPLYTGSSFYVPSVSSMCNAVFVKGKLPYRVLSTNYLKRSAKKGGTQTEWEYRIYVQKDQ